MTRSRFAGFTSRTSFLPVPAPLLGPLMLEMETLAELKVTLHLWRQLHETRRTPRYMLRSEVLADRALLVGIQSAGEGNPRVALEDGLRSAQERGVFISVAVQDQGREDAILLLNTPPNQRLAEKIRAGEVVLEGLQTNNPAAVPAEERPRIYALYEENIGMLTPLVAEELQEAEQTYPADWIEDAFRDAVGYNKRSWRYIRRILENWSAQGRGTGPRGEPGRNIQPTEDAGAYLGGRYGRFIKH